MNNRTLNFLRKNYLREDIELNNYIIDAIDNLESCYEATNKYSLKNIDSLKNEAVWSIIYDTYTRSYKYTEAALVLFITAQIASAEALCRTSVESSVNLYYLSIGSDVEKVISYFKGYIKTERDQNKKWKDAINNSNKSSTYKIESNKIIDEKCQSLDKYEDILIESFLKTNINYQSINNGWPNTFERFKKINKEIEYRTLYTALCSQAHNDAEDSLNDLISRITPIEGIEQGIETEKYIFSLDMILRSIQLWIEATMMFLARYEVKTNNELFDIWKKASTNIVELFENKPHYIENSTKEV